MPNAENAGHDRTFRPAIMAGFALRVTIRETIAKQSGHTTEVSGTAGEKAISIGKKTAEYQKKRKQFGRGHLRHDRERHPKKRESLAALPD